MVVSLNKYRYTNGWRLNNFFTVLFYLLKYYIDCTLVLALSKQTLNRVEDTAKTWATLSVGVLAWRREQDPFQIQIKILL